MPQLPVCTTLHLSPTARQKTSPKTTAQPPPDDSNSLSRVNNRLYLIFSVRFKVNELIMLQFPNVPAAKFSICFRKRTPASLLRYTQTLARPPPVSASQRITTHQPDAPYDVHSKNTPATAALPHCNCHTKLQSPPFSASDLPLRLRPMHLCTDSMVHT